MLNIFIKRNTSRSFLLALGLVCFVSSAGYGQTTNPNNPPIPAVPDTIKNNLVIPQNPADSGKNGNGQFLTLRQCIDFALQHQPFLNQSLLNVGIVKDNNAIALSGWLPQVNASGSLIHTIQSSSNGTIVNTGTGSGVSSNKNISNTFIPGIQVSQAIFSPSLFYAHNSAPLYVKQAQQATDSTKIFVVSNVTKSFYNVLLTLEQINVFKEDTARLGKNLRDAYIQYKGGIVDETDYEEAEITLNNSIAQLKQANENVVPQYAALKRLMGLPPAQQFNVSFDTTQMIQGINLDTTQQLAYEKRIEYQSIKTVESLQDQQINYYKYSFLPTLSAFYNYNLAYESNKVSDLFATSSPSSLVGLSFNIPIFTGFSRLHNVHKAKLEREIINLQETDLKSQIYSEYTSALANYKSNYYNLKLLQKNVALAKRTYFVVTLQYKQGIVPYLNVITAESNLITSEINYINALFQLLSSKIDLEKAMGSITY